ncbi:tripartite tricarboxylate transporter TctB family protein [Oceanobacillus timonensis]|uniref:tripartite tricarboxylate transporter TctB family protein n=1 Tax=Oceanobacillus timonensis TaxID=1926285 RepID=UPI0009BAEFFA|nr:tripartite tricarboxylate transporter TctB family protein [Oceanobacillus timonensis]
MKINKDLASPIAFLLLSIICLTTVSSMNALSIGFPLFILILMFLLSIILLIQTIIGTSTSQDAKGVIFTTQTVVTAVALILYAGLIWLIGFFISSLLYLGFMTWYLQKRDTKATTRVLKSVSGAVITTTVFYVIFRYGLLVYLPTGVLF